MIDSQRLLADLQRQVTRLRADLRERAAAEGQVRDTVEQEYAAAKAAGRTALSQSAWMEELLVQGAVAWVLATVFVRFMEDNGLVEEVWLSGPGDRRDVGRGRRQTYFERNPQDSERDLLHAAFAAAERSPAVAGLFDRAHNPLWRLPISGDAARELIELWDALDPEAEEVRLRHDFTDPARDTRFLGDLYQDLSEDAKKRYALLQTPEFVERFILDRTLEPALAEFGLEQVKLIDPTCGSGHFLIGAFRRLFGLWEDRHPSMPEAARAQRALSAVHGVDVNPFAVAIARFRLIVEALNACGVKRLADAPGWELRLACGDSLLHGPRAGQLSGLGAAAARRGIEHHFLTEDAGLLEEILTPGYHAVVGNPPYIVARDKALNDAYRERYRTCKGKYSLSVPFMERFFELAQLHGGAGFVGKITGNAFMKREFGSRLIEEFFPKVDLQSVVDAAGAHIPGHGTPTVILFGRAREPVSDHVRAVMGIRGEPSPPKDPAEGLVWRAIVDQVDRPGSESAYVSVEDVPRPMFHKHPWSLGGGGASELAQALERGAAGTLSGLDIGVVGMSNADDTVLRAASDWRRAGVPARYWRPLVLGDGVRDWTASAAVAAWFPYDASGLIELEDDHALRAMWPSRTTMWARQTFARLTYREEGRAWYEWHQIALYRLRTPLTITFGEIATHNHFVLDRGGRAFKQAAPVIKLSADASEEEHLALLGILNSSTACFWLKQVCQQKPGFDEQWEARHAFNGTNVAELPLPASRPATLAKAIDAAAVERAALLDDLGALLAGGAGELDRAAAADAGLLGRMISLQEELDWQTMAAYGLLPAGFPAAADAPPPLRLGERAFEIVLARRMRDDGLQTTWFDRHGSSPVVDPLPTWPAGYRAVVEQRIALIESDRDVGLVERPEHKRRWSQPPYAEREAKALRGWLLDELEALDLWKRGELVTCSRLADALRHDDRARLAAERLAGTRDVDFDRLIEELVLDEAVPYLAAHRYTESGMRVRAEWERTWELQRAEDAIDALGLPPTETQWRKRDEVGEIPVPPRYSSTDFRKTAYWRLRGRLDVPRERFVLVPEGTRTADPSPVVGWAGWDHPTLGFALAGRATMLRQQDGAGEERLVPLLAGIAELLPWVRQWHPEPDPDTGEPPARELEDFVADELGSLGRTREDLAAWRPPAAERRGRAARTA